MAKRWFLPFYLFNVRRPEFRHVTFCKAETRADQTVFGVEPGKRLQDYGGGRGISAASTDKTGARPMKIVSFSCQKPGRPPEDYAPQRRNKRLLFSSRATSNLAGWLLSYRDRTLVRGDQPNLTGGHWVQILLSQLRSNAQTDQGRKLPELCKNSVSCELVGLSPV